MKVIFFSRDGSSRIAAELLSERLGGAPLVELVEPYSRNGIFGFVRSGFQAVRGKASRLSGDPWAEIVDEDEIYLVSPIWAGNPNPAMLAFLTGADLSGKRVHTVTIQADPKHERAEAVHDALGELITSTGGTQGKQISLTGERPGGTTTRESMALQVTSAL